MSRKLRQKSRVVRDWRLQRLDPLVRKMHRDYTNGLTLSQVGEKYGRHATDISSLFRVRNLPVRTGASKEALIRGGLKHRTRLDALVLEMHAFYMTGKSLHEVGKRFGGRTHGCVRELFVLRGLFVRPFKQLRRLANGAPAPLERKSAREIAALIASATKMCVPDSLKAEWRQWSRERRADFIARLRARLQPPDARPVRPFSRNVKPFDYSSSEAHEIARRANAAAGKPTAATGLRISSEGVIYKSTLYYWVWEGKPGQGAYYAGSYTPEHGRPALHRVIWEEANRRRVPPGHVVRFMDGNPNNLAPSNLILATRNDLARENQAAHLLKQSREITALLLSQSKERKSSNGLRMLEALSSGNRA